MSFPPCPSPPPPLPSPVLVPTPLPAPPPSARNLNHALSHDALHRAARSSRVGAHITRRPSPPRTIKHTLSQLSSRCRSPPPSPATRSPPPPVPPIPPFVLAANHSFIRRSVPNRAPPFDLYLDRPSEDAAIMRQAGGPLTCVQFFAVHNPKGQ